MNLPADKKIYFASDFHLGVPDYESSLAREKKIVRWLSSIESDAAEIYLVGDIFDFWFEYKYAVPRGYVRLLGKLAELSDKGITLHIFTGNHDMWIFDYLPQEIGAILHRKPIVKTYNNRKLYIGHGDGLGPGDYGYKFIKKVFANKFCQWAFARLHPNFGIGLANYFSRKSRKVNAENDLKFLGKENEWLAIYAKEYLQKEPIDYFIFGHRHLPLTIRLNEKSTYINLGEWIHHSTYAVFDGKEVTLKTFEP